MSLRSMQATSNYVVASDGAAACADPFATTDIELRLRSPASSCEVAVPKDEPAAMPYAAYTDDFGSGNTGSCVRMLVGHTTEICSPAFCITTGVERSFWPESGVPGRKNLTP